MIDTSLFVASGPGVRRFTVERSIGAPVELVFRAFADGEAFAKSFDPSRPELRGDIELAIGGKYEWLWDGKTGSNDCQVLCYVPDRMLSFSWNAPPSQPESRAKRTWVVVEFLAENEGATRVVLHHLGFGDEAHWDETMQYFERAWGHVLGQFASNLEAK